MVWIFERGTETLQIETRFDSGKKDYLLIHCYPNGQDVAERSDVAWPVARAGG
jgi:hypothetical protein